MFKSFFNHDSEDVVGTLTDHWAFKFYIQEIARQVNHVKLNLIFNIYIHVQHFLNFNSRFLKKIVLFANIYILIVIYYYVY